MRRVMARLMAGLSTIIAAGLVFSCATPPPAPQLAPAPPRGPTYEDGLRKGREEGFTLAVESLEPLTRTLVDDMSGVENFDITKFRVYLSKRVTLSSEGSGQVKPGNDFVERQGGSVFYIDKGKRGRIATKPGPESELEVDFGPIPGSEQEGDSPPTVRIWFKVTGDGPGQYQLKGSDPLLVVGTDSYRVGWTGEAPHLIVDVRGKEADQPRPMPGMDPDSKEWPLR